VYLPHYPHTLGRDHNGPPDEPESAQPGDVLARQHAIGRGKGPAGWTTPRSPPPRGTSTPPRCRHQEPHGTRSDPRFSPRPAIGAIRPNQTDLGLPGRARAVPGPGCDDGGPAQLVITNDFFARLGDESLADSRPLFKRSSSREWTGSASLLRRPCRDLGPTRDPADRARRSTPFRSMPDKSSLCHGTGMGGMSARQLVSPTRRRRMKWVRMAAGQRLASSGTWPTLGTSITRASRNWRAA